MTYKIVDKYLWNELRRVVVLLLPEQSSPSQERSVCRSSSQRTVSHVSINTYTELVVDHVVMQVAHQQPRCVCLLFFLHALYIPIALFQPNP